MKILKYVLPLIIILSLSKTMQCYSQKIPVHKQYKIDSLNAVINNTSNHDTTLAKAYIDLSETLYFFNIDTLKILSEKVILITESALKKNNETTKRSLLLSKANALHNIGYVHKYKGDYTKALYYYNQSLTIFKKLNSKKEISSAISNIGQTYANQGNIAKTLEYYKKALSIREESGDKKGIAISFNNIGLLYKTQGDISQGLEYLHKALKINEEIDNQNGIATSLNNIGGIYETQDDIAKAMKYYHQSLEIRKEQGSINGIARCLNNIALVYKSQKDIPKAIEYLNKALKHYKKSNNKGGVATVYNNLGSIYRNLGEFSRALDYHDKSLQRREVVGNKKGISVSLINIGVIMYDLGKIEIAQNYGKRSLALAQEINYVKGIKKASHLLSLTYKKKNKGMQALKMYKLFITMRDSLKNEATQKATVQQQAKYEYEKQKAVDDAENDKLLAIEQEEKEKQQVLTFATAIGLGFVIIFLFFVFNRLRVTKKQKIVIEQQKQEVEQQKEMVEIAHKETELQKEIIEESHKEITDSINYAERIQRSFLATKDILDANLKDYFVYFKPKDVVSGDFYWAGHLQNGNFAVVNADSTGHGVPGAIMSILNISSIEKAIEQGENEPSEIFNKTRNTIIERLKKDGSKEGGKDGMDASIVCFDFKNNKFTYTAANNPIWIIRKNELTIIKPDKIPVGKHDNDSISFSQGEFEFQKGDQIYTLTDGFQDQFGGPKGKKFMVKKMRAYLLSISHLPMAEQHKKLNEVFTNWRGEHEQVDDVCVIGVRI